MSDLTRYYQLLFRPGEGVCWSSTPYGTAVKPFELMPRYCSNNYVCINPLNPHLDLDAHKPQHSQFIGRRADINVTAFRNILLEFDKGELHEQRATLEASGVPYSTLVFSGGKSLHAIISLERALPDRESYRRTAKRIYERIASCDTSVSNPSRFTRAPGAMRGSVRQELLYVGQNIPNEQLELWLGPEPAIEVTTPRTQLQGVLKPSTDAFLAVGAPEGGWNNALFKAAADMTRAGYDKYRIIELCRRLTGYLDEKDLRTIDSAVRSSRESANQSTE